MGLMSKMFGKKSTPSFTKTTKKASGKTVYKQEKYTAKDNKGTIIKDHAQATKYWVERNMSNKKDPFVSFSFVTIESAREAVLELPYMHLTSDTKELICLKKLVYGVYLSKERKIEVLLSGYDLTYDLWEKAKQSFLKHGGVRKSDQEPSR